MRLILAAILALTVTSCKSQRSKAMVSDSTFRNAVRNGKVELVRNYIRDGYDIHRLGMGGENALHEGILHFKVAELLIAEGINVNQQHKYDGSTPLIVSCIAANIEARTVELLLGSGADKSIKDIHGKTALSYAEEAYDEESKNIYEYDEKILLLQN